MNRKIRSGIVALAAAIFALAIVIAPTRAMALDTDENVEIYADPSKGIYVLMENDRGVFDNTVNVDVYVDGTLVAEKTVQNVPASEATVEVNAPFYNIDASGDGSITERANGRFRITYVGEDERDLRIDLSSTRGEYDITNPQDGVSYGTLSWAKSDASNTGYERTLFVEVDGRRVYQTTVYTPELLLNTGPQDEYWFTPNTGQFSAEVELTPKTLDAATQKDITVSLTSKSAVEPEENTWVTPYGTVGYIPNEDGYRMTVELYVNNEKVDSKDLGRIDQDVIGSLSFAPGAGYRYMGGEKDFMSYELDTAMSGATWSQKTGSIVIGPAIGTATEEQLNYPSVLKIYLYTDVNWVPLKIFLNSSVENQVQGYVVSYDVFDPASGETKTYTTRVSFTGVSGSKAARVLVPWGTKVSLSAVCDPGCVVTESYTDQGAECQYVGENGWYTPEGSPTQEHARGNTSYLTITSSDTVDMTVTVDKTGNPSAPTKDEVIDALGGNATVDCINENTSHEGDPWTTPLTEDSITVGEVQGNTSVTVTVVSTTYVAGYNEAIAEGHELVEGQNLTYTLTHNGEKWVAADGTNVTINVDCHTEPVPEGPNPDRLAELLDVTVTCTKEGADHGNNEVVKFEGLLPYSYEIGKVDGNAADGYTCDVTIKNTEYVTSYSSEEYTGVGHKLDENEQAEKTVALTWDAENEEWNLADGATAPVTVNFDVVCETPVPDLPDTAEEISGLFEKRPVVIDCVNREIGPQHKDGEYDLKAGTYGWENFDNANGVYSADLRVHPTSYVSAYNETNPGHQLTDDGPASQTIHFVYDAEAKEWKIPEDQPEQFRFEVECATPVPEQPELPTEEVLGELFADALVTVDCTTEGVEHNLETFAPIAEGGYAFGTIDGDVEAGATVEMTVFPEAYVGAYEARCDNVPHALNESQTSQTVTLTYLDGEWSAPDGFTPIAYTVFCTSCPVDNTPDAPTVPEVDELFVSGAVKVTCVNDKTDHGSETYGLKSGYATVGAVYGNETDGWKVDVTVTPYGYVYDFQTAKGVHHTLSPEDQGELTMTLSYVDGEWTLPTEDAQFAYTVVCADESPTPGKPSDSGDDTGGDKGGNTGDNTGNNTGENNSGKLPSTGDTTNTGVVAAVAVAGVAVAGAALVAHRRRQ